MYLAALRRQGSSVSTYFAELLGVVGGGGPPQKINPIKNTTDKKCPVNY